MPVFDTRNVTYMTHVLRRKLGKWGIPEKSIKNIAQRCGLGMAMRMRVMREYADVDENLIHI